MPENVIEAAVGVILRSDGTVLLGSRPEGKPWAGMWELPGGKIEPGESVMQALTRELQEELGINVTDATPWVTYEHVYPTATVKLSFCRVTGWEGEPQGLEGQSLQWVDIAHAEEVPQLLPATYPPLRWLLLPEIYAISSVESPAGVERFLKHLDNAWANGLKMLQWREPAWPSGSGADDFLDVLQTVISRCHAAKAKVLVNSIHPEAWWPLADGVHLRQADAQLISARPAQLTNLQLLAVSTHDAQEIAHARLLGADFVLLGPVLPTKSHPDHPGIGWETFTSLNEQAGLPVYALGGQSRQTLQQAKRSGAHGIAAIRGGLD